MKLKKLAALILALAMVLSLAACGGSSSSSTTTTGDSSTTTASSDGSYSVTSLTVNIWDNNQQAGLQEIADEWTETSGVSVTVNVVDWDNYWTLLEAGVSGGDMPDVFWMHSNTSQMYMENDVLLNLDDYIAADDDIDMANYYDGIVDLYNSDGVQYAVPKDHDTIALLYNKAIFDEYGIDYPTDDWSWDDVLAAATAITEAGTADGVYGFAMNTSNNQDGWYNLIYGYGGEVVTEDHTDTTIDSDESKAGMEMMRQILAVSTPQTTVAETGTDSLFMSGKVAMITQGSWMVTQFYQAENSADYFWVEIPYADANGNGECDEGERVSSYNGLGWAAAYNTADPQAAYDLISWFCNYDNQVKQAELGVTMSGYVGADDAFSTAFGDMDVSAFLKVEEDGTLFFRPYTRNTTVWEDALQQTGCFLDAWLDPSDPDLMSQACDNAATIIRDAIAAE
ncbi:MAG: sugar ABC transporter substrate-binding protein [Clostridiales bacterium]|nr:sugar ABC transporter substrate-binding protein [Clostridiales bacterium]